MKYQVCSSSVPGAFFVHWLGWKPIHYFLCQLIKKQSLPWSIVKRTCLFKLSPLPAAQKLLLPATVTWKETDETIRWRGGQGGKDISSLQFPTSPKPLCKSNRNLTATLVISTQICKESAGYCLQTSQTGFLLFFILIKKNWSRHGKPCKNHPTPRVIPFSSPLLWERQIC